MGGTAGADCMTTASASASSEPEPGSSQAAEASAHLLSEQQFLSLAAAETFE